MTDRQRQIVNAIIERMNTLDNPQYIYAWASYTDELPRVVTYELTKEFDDILEAYYKRERITYIEQLQDKAFYNPSADMIMLPSKEQFKSVAGYYSAKAHETIHSTGDYTRCYRDGFSEFKSISFGSPIYSREELTAEIGACFLLDALGVDTERAIESASVYLWLWRSKLNNNNRWIYETAELSADAVEYIING